MHVATVKISYFIFLCLTSLHVCHVVIAEVGI